jgi:hypothetical protein
MSNPHDLQIRINNYSSESNSPSSTSSSSSPIYIRRVNRRYFRNENVNDIESNICNICQDEPKDIVNLRCSHSICLQCFLNWFKNNKICPYCRQEIDIEIFTGDETNVNERLIQYVNLLQENNNRLQIENENINLDLDNNPSYCCNLIYFTSFVTGLIYIFIYHVKDNI